MTKLNIKDAVIIIPSRIASTRISNKPLKKIGDKTVIEWVVEQALKIDTCDVVVACCGLEIADSLKSLNVKCVLTDPDIKSGTDRVFDAYKKLEGNYKYIINLQGDMPFVKSETIIAVYNSIKNDNVDIATVATPLKCNKTMHDLSVVEAITTDTGRALYFTRYYDSRKNWELLEHIGIYGYTSQSLEKFSSLDQTFLEKSERLEQLRALENNMSMQVTTVDDPHISVDTKKDLEVAQEYYKNNLREINP